MSKIDALDEKRLKVVSRFVFFDAKKSWHEKRHCFYDDSYHHHPYDYVIIIPNNINSIINSININGVPATNSRTVSHKPTFHWY